MLPLKEMRKIMKLPYAMNNGVISSYFLALFMYMISLVTVVMSVDIDTLNTLQHLKRANMYFQQEIIVINDIKAKLDTQIELQDAVFDNFSYTCIQQDNIIYISIDGEYAQELCVTLDLDTNRIIDYDCMRH